MTKKLTKEQIVDAAGRGDGVKKPEKSKRFEEFTKLMNFTPDWAKGLPIASKSWSAKRYTK
jgi:hypothetical protein